MNIDVVLHTSENWQNGIKLTQPFTCSYLVEGNILEGCSFCPEWAILCPCSLANIWSITYRSLWTKLTPSNSLL